MNKIELSKRQLETLFTHVEFLLNRARSLSPSIKDAGTSFKEAIEKAGDNEGLKASIGELYRQLFTVNATAKIQYQLGRNFDYLVKEKAKLEEEQKRVTEIADETERNKAMEDLLNEKVEVNIYHIPSKKIEEIEGVEYGYLRPLIELGVIID